MGVRTAVASAEAELARELDALVDARVVPGGVALVLTSDGIVFEHAFGHRALQPAGEPVTADTLWDCASLTKPLVTASLLLRLRGRGALDFTQPISDWLPVLAQGEERAPTVAELLLHAGGLPAWEPLYAVAPGGMDARIDWLAAVRVRPGVRAEYGCPGYQVLGRLVEELTGRPLAEAAGELWAELDEEVHFPVPRELASRCAPTEHGNAFERDLAGERASGCTSYREELIRGEVHDHNAFTLGGAAGNAGLFATGRGVAALLRRFLEPGTFSASDLEELARTHSPSAADGEDRTWGFQCARSLNSAAGPDVSDRGFGHCGFTGTSVMVDPDRGAGMVLLTNRIHPRWTAHGFHADRRRFHSAALRLVDASRG